MSGLPTLEPAHVGRLIVAVAVVVVVSLVAIVVSRDRAVRPDLSALPLPEGAVTHAAVEDCSDGDPPVCTAYLAVGPTGGIELPRATEVMLAEHLRDEGWTTTDESDDVRVLVSPGGRLLVEITDYRPEDVPAGLEAGVDEDVDRDDLAELVVAAGEDA